VTLNRDGLYLTVQKQVTSSFWTCIYDRRKVIKKLGFLDGN